MKTKQLLSSIVTLKTRYAAIIGVVALLASPGAFAQVKIGTNPTTIEPNSNLEVEASTAGRKMKVDKTTGQVSIADGTQGAGKVFTSDANGGGSWQTLRSTAISTFNQPAGIVLDFPTGGGGSYCPYAELGSAPMACATDLGRNGNFVITNPVNDVALDVTGPYTMANNSTPAQFFILLYVDKTTPGVYELVDRFIVSNTFLSCNSGYLNFKSTLKNLPARTYNVKVYEEHWYNPGAPAKLAFGSQAVAGCGDVDFVNQRLIVSVSQ